MKNPFAFYAQQKKILEKEATNLKAKYRRLSAFRFAIFVGICFLVYATFGRYPLVFINAFLGVLVFVFLVVKHSNLKRKRSVVEAKITINEIEINVLNRDFHDLETGAEFIDAAHFYSNDIDLFGKGSFFQYMNRTQTKDGKVLLANTLTENKTTTIAAHQTAAVELSEKVLWRQHFGALASLISVKNTATAVASWIANYAAVLPKYLAKVQIIFSLISLLLIGLVSFEILSFAYITFWFFIGLFITGRFVKKTSQLYTETDETRAIFRQYYQLLNEIEKESFTASILKEKQELIRSETNSAASIFKEFSRTLDTFDQRGNMIVAVVGNGLFLSEIYSACKVEKWIFKYQHTVEKWFEVVAFFDAKNSLANFHFNHPKYVFPEIITEKETIMALHLGHPLLKSKSRIDNDFSIEDEQFFIVTGANMAGKSTFLRTISLAIVMANCGLPVCAGRFVYSPIKLITSMRTSDSLSDDESYFYSELKRLKFIVDAIKEEKYFIILDEILKGTNSKDKAIGSKKFVEKLSKSKSTGIIATHDVSLCALADEVAAIKNYYFDAEIIDDELHFDYALKDGVCKNMNASFLLHKMEII
jgi:ABC-type Na+ transport system ATPase subunit NatA